MKKLKLLFVAPTAQFSGGGEMSHYQLILAAKQRQHQVHVVVPAEGQLAEALKAKSISHSVIEYHWWGPFHQTGYAATDLAAVGEIANLALKLKSDVIVTNSLNIPWGALAAAAANRPHVWLAREMPLHQFSYLEDHYDFINNYGNLVLANSKTNEAYIKERVKRPVAHLYPYVEVRELKLGRSRAKPRLVNVGNIQPGKNQLELIQAAGELKKKGQPLPVLLIGNQPDETYNRQVQQAITKYGLQKLVTIKTFQAEPYSLISPNDIVVQTSGYESFGRTTVEAMKLGLVCLAADTPANREVFSLGGGTLYKLGSPSDLAAKIEMVLTDLKGYQQQAKTSQAKALENLSEATCHQAFFENIAKLVGQDHPRHELRHVLPQLADLGRNLEELRGQVDKYQQLTKAKQQELEKIINSRAYQTALRLRRLLGR